MGVPRILAINDVHLAAAPEVAAEVLTFYRERLGLVALVSGRGQAVFRGARRAGPKLVVRFDKPSTPLRGQVLVQVDSLAALAEELADHGEVGEWVRGLSFFDRRLVVSDPAGNRLHLVTYHPL